MIRRPPSSPLFPSPPLSRSETPELDVVIDGADEIDPRLDLIKGLGGAHLREKVVACAGRLMVVIADEAKLVSRLGERVPLPDRKSTRLNSSHSQISYAVFCL